MKRVVFLSIVLGLMLMIAGCGSDPVGKYVNVYNESEYITLKGDGSCTVKVKAGTFRGKYNIQGDNITFIIEGSTDRCEYDGKFILDNEGNSWEKQK